MLLSTRWTITSGIGASRRWELQALPSTSFILTSQDARNMLPSAISPPALDVLPLVSPRGQSWGPCSFLFTCRPWEILAWMPDELSHAHTFFGREVRSGVAPLGRNYLLTKICEEIDRPIKLSGRALYDDGQMINRNVINHVTKELLGLIRFQQTWLPLES